MRFQTRCLPGGGWFLTGLLAGVLATVSFGLAVVDMSSGSWSAVGRVVPIKLGFWYFDLVLLGLIFLAVAVVLFGPRLKSLNWLGRRIPVDVLFFGAFVLGLAVTHPSLTTIYSYAVQPAALVMLVACLRAALEAAATKRPLTGPVAATVWAALLLGTQLSLSGLEASQATNLSLTAQTASAFIVLLALFVYLAVRRMRRPNGFLLAGLLAGVACVWLVFFGLAGIFNFQEVGFLEFGTHGTTAICALLLAAALPATIYFLIRGFKSARPAEKTPAKTK